MHLSNHSTSQERKQQDFFLPDFCQIQSLFLVLIIGELLAVIFTLLNYQTQTTLWQSLGIYSLSVQIISLVSVSCLCWLRSLLAQFNDWISGLLSLVVILLITFIFTLLVINIYWQIPLDFKQPEQQQLILRHLLIAGIIGSAALRYFYLLQQYRRQLLAESAARLDALQARIRPHFLFNSMNVIASLTRIDPAKAEAAIEDLADLFRATLNTSQSLIPFAQELENSERYLAIEKLRLGEKLMINKIIAPETLGIMLPALSVQPLLENAVYHGIQTLASGGVVTINAKLSNGYLTITIENPKAQQQRKSGHGIALDNITQRLAVIYAGKASLKREPAEDSYRITMSIPVSKPD